MRLTSRFAAAFLLGAVFTTAFSAAAFAAGNNGSITSRAQLPHREIVRVTIHTPQDMRDLQILDLDMTEAITPTSAEVVVTNEDKATLARHGFLFSVVDPDIDASFAKLAGAAPYPTYFHTYASMLSQMQAVHTAYPTLTSAVVSIGQTLEGRDIWAIEVSNAPGSHNATKAEVLMMGCHHAREPMSVEATLDLLNYLTTQYGLKSEVTNIVNNQEVWIVPMVNPDGHVYCETTDQNWRKNRKNNGDGTFGVDNNRNYSYKWGLDNVGSSNQGGSDTYRGTGPNSELENQHVRDFMAQHNFFSSISFHSYGQYVIYPWGYGYNLHTPDHLTFNVSADSMNNSNGYAIGTAPELLYLVNGEYCDWAYGETTQKPLNYGYTMELGTTFYPAESQVQGILDEVRPSMTYLIRSAQPAAGEATVTLSTHAITLARGGTLSFSYDVRNNTAGTVTWKQWNEVVMPSGQPITANPAGGYKTMTLAPGEVRTTNITKVLPTNAPTGNYTWTSKAAVNAPWPVLGSDKLTFTVTTLDLAAAKRGETVALTSTAGADAGDLGDWQLVDGASARIATTPASVMAKNGGATVAFAANGGALPRSLPVFDLNGRVAGQAAVAAVGVGQAQAIWNLRDSHGAAASHGIYFVRAPGGANTRIVVTR